MPLVSLKSKLEMSFCKAIKNERYCAKPKTASNIRPFLALKLWVLKPGIGCARPC